MSAPPPNSPNGKLSSVSDAPARARARKGGIIAVLLIATALLWLFLQWLGGQIGIGTRYMVLFDLIALGIFFALMCNAFWLWRSAKG